jgi:2'-5' RNA ligase
MALLHADEESGDASIRAFVAIGLDDTARRVVAQVITALRAGTGGGAVRWVPPENLHVTLCFLGNAAVEQLGSLVSSLRRSATALAPFSMRLGAVAVFPSPQRPRVVSCEVGPEPTLEQLAQVVARAASRAGFALEARPFRPHLTLGRFRERKPASVTSSVTGVDQSVCVDEIVLYRSQLRPTGALHIPLERIVLGGSDHP